MGCYGSKPTGGLCTAPESYLTFQPCIMKGSFYHFRCLGPVILRKLQCSSSALLHGLSELIGPETELISSFLLSASIMGVFSSIEK